MPRSLLALVLFLLLCLGQTQRASGQRPAGMGAPSIGRIYGRVLDASTNKGAEYTTVAVRLAAKDSIIGGAITRANGEFEVDKLPVGRPLKVTINFIGYKPVEQAVQLTRERMELDLGNIALSLRLLEQFGSTRVLSSPKLMALNNQSALLKVVDNIVYFNIQADTNTNQTTSTTTFTSTARTVPVGLIMSVLPQITESGTVNLTVRPTISSV